MKLKNILKSDVSDLWKKLLKRSQFLDQEVAHPKMKKIINLLKYSSSTFALGGGIILAANIDSISRYGFIFLACSSMQLLVSSTLSRDKSLIIYSASLFFFVDCLGVYRWLLS